MASVALNGSITSQTMIGRFTLTPGVTYTDSYLDFSNMFVITAIARGTLVFNDGVNTLNGYIANPTVAQMIKNWNVVEGDSVPGAAANPSSEPPPVMD